MNHLLNICKINGAAAATKRLAEHMAQIRLPLPTVVAEQTRI
jgi:hypothetical protein